jgi:putative endonuclease
VGEQVAARFLRRKGCRVLAKNYRCPAGEIDLICRDGGTLVFVEVKSRSSFQRESPTEAAHPRQWKRIDRAAHYFLRQRGIQSCPCRIDLVTVEWRSLGSVPLVTHYPDAFAAAVR